MAGFGNDLLNKAVKENTYNNIFTYILICCQEMTNDLCDIGIKIPNNENKIRNYLLKNYLDDNSFRRKNNMIMFRFMPEVPENYEDDTFDYEGRVDIKIISQNASFEDSDAAYYVECKRLDGYSRLNKEYVENGIKRFVVSPAHYNSYYNRNFMLGFMVKKIDIDGNTKKIELIQESDKNINNLCGLINHGEGSVHTYDCEYSIDGKTIELKHIFTDISQFMA